MVWGQTWASGSRGTDKSRCVAGGSLCLFPPRSSRLLLGFFTHILQPRWARGQAGLQAEATARGGSGCIPCLQEHLCNYLPQNNALFHTETPGNPFFFPTQSSSTWVDVQTLIRFKHFPP